MRATYEEPDICYQRSFVHDRMALGERSQVCSEEEIEEQFEEIRLMSEVDRSVLILVVAAEWRLVRRQQCLLCRF
jgi:hypothetical protein